MTTLATLELGLPAEDPETLHGHTIPRGWVEEELGRLAASSVDEIRALPGMHPDRAPVFVAGVLVVAETLAYFDLAALEVSERDILLGGALAAAEIPEPEEGLAPPGAFTCC